MRLRTLPMASCTVSSGHDPWLLIKRWFHGDRRLSWDELRRLADGRIYTAGQALDGKLIDRVGYLDDVIASVR